MQCYAGPCTHSHLRNSYRCHILPVVRQGGTDNEFSDQIVDWLGRPESAAASWRFPGGRIQLCQAFAGRSAVSGGVPHLLCPDGDREDADDIQPPVGRHRASCGRGLERRGNRWILARQRCGTDSAWLSSHAVAEMCWPNGVVMLRKLAYCLA